MCHPEGIDSGGEVDGIAAYEGLRAHFMGKAPSGFVPLGLAVLRRHGVGAWFAQEIAARKLDAPHDNVKFLEGGAVDPKPNELVRLLAATTLMVMKARSR